MDETNLIVTSVAEVVGVLAIAGVMAFLINRFFPDSRKALGADLDDALYKGSVRGLWLLIALAGVHKSSTDRPPPPFLGCVWSGTPPLDDLWRPLPGSRFEAEAEAARRREPQRKLLTLERQ